MSDFATSCNDPEMTQRAYKIEPDEFRNEFERDYTRIIHSRAFRRLRHKTQVFVSPNNDHICTRLEHSLHVASISKTIAKKLDLNEDLVLAIAVGHDLGHAPFGHRGEECLKKIVEEGKKKAETKTSDAKLKHYASISEFHHEKNSLRMVEKLDSPYEEHSGLNLTFAVRDGIACHCGEELLKELSPRDKKEVDLYSYSVLPKTLEGCIVRIADVIAYLGRDMEDAITAEIITRDQLPSKVQKHLGKENRNIIHSLIADVCDQSKGKYKIVLSDDVFEAICEFRKFSMGNIYENEKVKKHFDRIEKSMEVMFEEIFDKVLIFQQRPELIDCPQDTLVNQEVDNFKVLRDFLKTDIKKTWQDENPVQLTIDFVSGMTDTYFISYFKSLFLPQPTF
ncbi:MAG TPA: dNTP triphosphohydrolase [bacterium]|nr:dNTP triphosphohydrolase [bacterium]